MSFLAGGTLCVLRLIDWVGGAVLTLSQIGWMGGASYEAGRKWLILTRDLKELMINIIGGYVSNTEAV